MREIIFADGEFTGLRSDGTEFISLALIKSTEEELYIEIESDSDINIWTQENVVPFLDGNPISKDDAKKCIVDFVGLEKPYFLSYVNQFDWMGICGMFGVHDVPFYWIPLDFASILYAKGIDPATTPEKLAKDLKIDLSAHKKHHALHDARLLREVYDKINNL